MTARAILWNWLVHGDGPSGANRRRVELLRAVLRRKESGLERRFVILTKDGAPEGLSDPRVTWLDAPVPSSALARSVLEGRLLHRATREYGCDCVVHESLPAPRLGSTPLILTVHDFRDLHGEFGMSSAFRRAAAPRLWRTALARARRLVAVSEFTRSEGVAFEPASRDRWRVVPNAADHIPLTDGPVARDPESILYVGHLEARKGADLALGAFVDIARDRPAARLRFAGAGPLATSLRAAARGAGIADRVTIAPARDDAELCQLYARATVAVVPSRYEGFGIPLLEAQRLGCPVVAARAGALPEIGAEAAVWVDGFEPAAWAAKVRRLLADPNERARLAEAGRRRAACFSWDASAARFLDAIDGALTP